jgi:hypothetical protein
MPPPRAVCHVRHPVAPHSTACISRTCPALGQQKGEGPTMPATIVGLPCGPNMQKCRARAAVAKYWKGGSHGQKFGQEQ